MCGCVLQNHASAVAACERVAVAGAGCVVDAGRYRALCQYNVCARPAHTRRTVCSMLAALTHHCTRSATTLLDWHDTGMLEYCAGQSLPQLLIIYK